VIKGWNVTKDTVLQINTTPIDPKTLIELGIDERTLTRAPAQDTNTKFFVDVRRGVRYSVQDNYVISMQHTPVSEDNELRCQGFPPFNGGVTDYMPYASFSGGSNERILAQLDELAFQLAEHLGLKAYIITYAGKSARQNKAKDMGRMAREYLIKKRRISTNRVYAVDGGFRETAEFELYLLSDDMPPPGAESNSELI
jgi:hypothetical protein